MAVFLLAWAAELFGSVDEPDHRVALVVTPVLLDWLLVGSNLFRARGWEALTWWILLAICAIYGRGHIRDHFGFEPYDYSTGELPIEVLLLFVIGSIFAYLLFGLGKARDAAIAAVRRQRT